MRPKRVIYVLVDGLSGALFQNMVDKGHMPYIEKYLINNGFYVKDCLSCFPANTAPANLAHLTGSYTNHHGIPLIKYWKPEIGIYKDFTKSSLSAIEDFNRTLSPNVRTIYEYFSGRTTAMHFVNRGASDIYAGKARSIFLYIYARTFGWNKLHSLAIRTALKRLGSKDPSRIIVLYLPGPDAISHELGPLSSEYYENVRNLDEQIRCLIEGDNENRGLDELGMVDDTLIVLSSDHGEISVAKTCPIEEKLREKGFDLATGRTGREETKKANILMAISGGVAFLNFRDQRSGILESEIAKLRNFVANENAMDILAWLRDMEGVNRLYLKEDANTYRILARDGESRILRKMTEQTLQYRYEIVEGEDPLHYDRNSETNRMIGDRFYECQEWLRAATACEALDMIDQVPRIYDCKDMNSTVIVSTLTNWSFKSKHKGEHDNENNEIRRVPLIIANAKIQKEKPEPLRTVDILPTLLDILGVSYDKRAIDGISLVSIDS